MHSFKLHSLVSPISAAAIDKNSLLLPPHKHKPDINDENSLSCRLQIFITMQWKNSRLFINKIAADLTANWKLHMATAEYIERVIMGQNMRRVWHNWMTLCGFKRWDECNVEFYHEHVHVHVMNEDELRALIDQLREWLQPRCWMYFHDDEARMKESKEV